jgi:hypothetical protein
MCNWDDFRIYSITLKIKFMNVVELQKLISDTDAALAAHPAQADQKAEMLSIGGTELSAIISIALIVLPAVKALLFWKPKWQSAIGDLIAYLQTFQAILP